MIFVQNEATAARRRFWLYLVDATDGLTPETGEAGGQPQISKNGGAFANTSATLTHIGSGSYYVELTAGELDTLGKIIVRYKSANTAEFSMVADVLALDVYTSVPAVTLTAAERDAVADAQLRRDWTAAELDWATAPARSLLRAVFILLNKVAEDGTQKVVYGPDDATESHRFDTDSNPNSEPITGWDHT